MLCDVGCTGIKRELYTVRRECAIRTVRRKRAFDIARCECAFDTARCVGIAFAAFFFMPYAPSEIADSFGRVMRPADERCERKQRDGDRNEQSCGAAESG